MTNTPTLASHWIIYAYYDRSSINAWGGGDPIFDRQDARAAFAECNQDRETPKVVFMEFCESTGVLMHSEDQTEAFSEWLADQVDPDAVDWEEIQHQKSVNYQTGRAA